MESDTAARQAISNPPAAGSNLDRRPLAHGKPGFKNDGFVAWGRRA